MYVETVPNRNSPPAILLRESYREGGKVKKRTLLNLSDWPRERIAGFTALLKGGTVIPSDQEAISIVRALPHGAQNRPRPADRARRPPSGSHPGARGQPDSRARLEARDRPGAVAGDRRLQPRR